MFKNWFTSFTSFTFLICLFSSSEWGEESDLKKPNISMKYGYLPAVLEPYNGPESRQTCPACGEHTFSLYRSAYNNSEVGDRIGKCDREKECGYHLTPKKHFASLKKRY